MDAGSRKNPAEVARNLFAALRMFDLQGATKVYSEAFYDTELGTSVMNRLEKAAEHRIMRV